MKTMLKALACVSLATAVSITAAAAFVKSNTYTDGQFTDVSAKAWYAAEVKSTFELGLMKGTGDGIFNPTGNVTVAEAVTMAARAASQYAGEEIGSAAGAWYQSYVNYGIKKGFVKEGQFDNYNRPAKRYEVAAMFENAMPEGYFTAKNEVVEIPDVSDAYSYQADLLTLYRAGVVMGSDSYGNFRPEDNITRAEAAAIINRVALPENRLVKKLDKVSDDDAYTMIHTDSFTGQKEGINSGWALDNTGGVPRTPKDTTYGSLFDISASAGTALIREFNKTETGCFNFLASATVGGGDGVYLEFRNDTDNSVYRLETLNGFWQLLKPDGNYKKLYEISKEEKEFDFHIKIDLDNNRSTTYINNTSFGTDSLLTSGAKTNIYNFRFATTEKSTGYITPGRVRMYANYAVWEDFDNVTKEGLPKEWKSSGNVTVDKMMLKLNGEKASASSSFTPVSGTVASEVNFLLPAKEKITYSAKSGTKNVAVFTSDADNFYVNGTKVYENYYANMWYRLRLEIDNDTQTVLVKLNGRKVGEVPFADAATSVDSISVINNSTGAVSLDDFKVFRLARHEDYVPVPVKPAGADNYNIGMNVCSLWENGQHYGWSCISPYDDAELVLGYYDEANPETADWEIKYLVEHGVDFQAFCIFFTSNKGPQKLDASHLYDGFMNAKYSDMAKYCVIWEAGNSNVPASVAEMRENFAPYFVENFFKDPRYMVIDNKPVVCVFGPAVFSNKIGGDANALAAFDVLEEEAKKLGFDGVIFLACGSSEDRLAALGYDGCYAYNWGAAGYQVAVNKQQITNSAKQGAVWTVPTVSVGFNNIAWNGLGERHPMMSIADYKETHEWVKNEYLPEYAKEDWQKNFVMLSTWNEYGEGTYIMPTTDERGFGYLDTIREVYTDESTDASINTIPTAEQKYRINHLYPQYRHLLRRQGVYEEEINVDELDVAFTIDYSIASANYWSTDKAVKDAKGVTGIAKNSDPIIIIQSITDKSRPNLDDIVAVRIKATLPKDSQLEFFYITDKDNAWSQSKSYMFPATTSDGEVEFLISAEKLKLFTGKLRGVRIDPLSMQGAQFTLKSVEFFARKPGTSASKKMNINGFEIEQSYAPERSGEDLLMAFDPATGVDFLLNTFYVWDKAEKKLTLNFPEHTVVYTVGSDKYLFDGKQEKLGYKLPEIDGLPMIPIEILCDKLGYTYLINEKNELSISTDQQEYFTQKNAEMKDGAWEFNNVGDTGNWTSRFMSLLVADGYMSCVSNSTSTDPTINNMVDISMPAEKFIAFETRIRYKTESKNPLVLQLFFHTNKASGDSEARSIKIPLKSTDSNGEWEVYTADLKGLETWKDTITRFRLDPFNASGTIDIDYIRFVVDPEYVDENVDPMTVPFKLTNPDAEGKDAGFENARIVSDPEDASNKCYMVVSRAGSATYAYSKQPVYFKPGYTYAVTARVRIASHGGRTDLSDGFAAAILCNMQYDDPTTGRVDHVVKRTNLTFGEGWKDISFEFTVDPESDYRGSDMFTFYADPIKNSEDKTEEIGYYFDDIVVKETAPEKE